MKKHVIRCVLPLLLFYAFLLPVAAQETMESEDAQQKYENFLQSIPPEVADLLPESFFETALSDSEKSIEEAGGVQAVLGALGKLTGLALRENLSLLAQICGILLLCEILQALSKDKGSEVGRAFSFLSTLALSVMLLTMQRDRFTLLNRFFDTVRLLCLSFLPLMGTLYAMGGNVRTAAVNHGVLSAFLSILETVCAATVLPIAGICLTFALLDAIAGRTQLRGLSSLIKRTYVLGISFLMSLLGFVLSTQSTLAKVGDTLAIRTARFAAGSFLPLVGSSVSESLRTAAASVSYLRGVAGSGAMLVLLFAFLPTFLSVLLTRITFLLGGSIAGMLDCEAQGRILAELGSVFGYFLGILAVIFVMLLFSLTLFARCAVAV